MAKAMIAPATEKLPRCRRNA